MNIRSAVAAYSIIIGIMMAAMWSVFALTDQIPELESSPLEISFHLAAELTTAFALLLGGVAITMRRHWGYQANMVALGMLSYTVIVSPGYYAESGELAFVAMFGVLMILTLAFIVISIVKKDDIRTEKPDTVDP
ncbi:MAG: hypothetical protein KKE24_08115 [Candidatus Thermoplasmatota archaeon]|nr:hypothetical protein [Candidatus Thermoplasmatota archaeon]